MAERPTLPGISSISPPVYNQAGVRDRVGRTATAVNLATEFANASSAFREASPDVVENMTTLDGLTADAPLLVDTDAVALESPGTVPAFADGGFHYVDEMLHARPIAGESTQEASARLARAINSRYELISTRSGNSIRYNTPSNGFSRLEIRAARNTYRSLTTDPLYGTPVFPNTLNSRIRCIVEHSTAIDPSINLLSYATNGRQNGRVHCTMWPAYSRGSARAIWPNFQYSERGMVSGIGGLSQFGTSGVLVFEMSVYPIGGDRTGLGVSADDFDIMRFRAGHYDNIEQAYADGGAGGAFACLEPDHPNYIGGGDRTAIGNMLPRNAGSTPRYFPGYHRFSLDVGDWNYVEITAGDAKNDVMNRLVGVPPVADVINAATEAEEADG